MPSWQSVRRTWELVNDVKARSAIRKGGGMIASCIQSVNLKSFLPVSTRSQGGVRSYVLRTRCGKIALWPAKQTQRRLAQRKLRMFVCHICSICNDKMYETYACLQPSAAS